MRPTFDAPGSGVNRPLVSTPTVLALLTISVRLAARGGQPGARVLPGDSTVVSDAR
jgi:hypothetical protein